LHHKKRFNDSGEERMIQKAFPSELMDGNTNLTARADITNPAMPILRKDNAFCKYIDLIGLFSYKDRL